MIALRDWADRGGGVKGTENLERGCRLKNKDCSGPLQRDHSRSTSGTSVIGYIRNSRSESTNFLRNIRCRKNSFRGKDRNLPTKQLLKGAPLNSNGGPIYETDKFSAFGFNLWMAKQDWSDDKVAGARRGCSQPCPSPKIKTPHESTSPMFREAVDSVSISF